MADEENQELILTINSLNRVLQESIHKLTSRLERLEQAQGQPPESGATAAGGTASGGELLKELQNQVLYLESQIVRTTNEIKNKQEERHNQMRDRLEAQVKSVEKLFEENRSELNKHSFNFAVLVLIIIIIGAFVMKSGLDHLTHYLTGQLDHIHSQLERILEITQSNPDNLR